MIEQRGNYWVVLDKNYEKARLYPYESGYNLCPVDGRVKHYKTFGRAMKALRKYEEAS